MRRSAAPSQNGVAKRQKFVSPAVLSSGPPTSKHSSALSTNPAIVTVNQPCSKTSSPQSCIASPLFKEQDNRRLAQKVSFGNQSHVLGLLRKESCPTGAQTSLASERNSEPPVRKKSDMLALLSKTLWKNSSACEPSQPPEEEEAKIPLSPSKYVAFSESNSPMPGSVPMAPQCSDSGSPSPGSRYFSVVWCKASKKKHKKWEGDAVLCASGRSVTLYDTEGKIIGRGTGYKVKELETLAEDETLFVGGKEIQVMSILTEGLFKSGKCFSSATVPCELSSTNRPTALSKTSGTFKPFTNPLLKKSAGSKQVGITERLVLQPKYDPKAENALVMPRPTPDQQWRRNSAGALPVVDVVVDPYLSSFLRKHQREGVVFLYMCVMGLREHGGLGAILADDMGLGKTLQCITLIWTLLKQGPFGGKPAAKKVLVITPGSLVKNWYLEFKKWLGTERLNVYAVSAEKRAEEFVKSNMYPVLVISYEMFVRCHDILSQVPFDLIICDEGHRLKNTAIKTTALIMSLQCRRRVVLTGTPVQNDLQEFYSIVEFCNPGLLGSSSAFRRVYEDPIVASRQPRATAEEKDLGSERAGELTRLTQMFVLRRTQEVNNDYLPPKVELVLFCRPSPLQTVLYQHLLRSKAVRLCLQSGRQHMSGSAHLAIIGALKQLCNHPKLLHRKVVQARGAGTVTAGQWRDEVDVVEEGSIYSDLHKLFPEHYDASPLCIEESGKLEVLSGILSSIWRYSSSDKVVLVSNHTKTLDVLQAFCEGCGYTCLRLDGQTPTGQRQELVNRFNRLSTHRIFLLSSKAGGVGLNLVGASRLILYDIDWNPANDLQAMARVWRDGQRGRVYIYRLLTTGSIEEKVYQRQISKQGLSGAVMDLTSHSSVQFSLEDLKDLFTLNETTDCETHTMLACPCDGEPNYIPDPAASQEEKGLERRPCQLGRGGERCKKTQLTNLTMAQLLSWKHWRGDFAKQEKSWYLEQVAETLSYVFWNETNS